MIAADPALFHLSSLFLCSSEQTTREHPSYPSARAEQHTTFLIIRLIAIVVSTEPLFHSTPSATCYTSLAHTEERTTIPISRVTSTLAPNCTFARLALPLSFGVILELLLRL